MAHLCSASPVRLLLLFAFQLHNTLTTAVHTSFAIFWFPFVFAVCTGIALQGQRWKEELDEWGRLIHNARHFHA